MKHSKNKNVANKNSDNIKGCPEVESHLLSVGTQNDDTVNLLNIFRVKRQLSNYSPRQ